MACSKPVGKDVAPRPPIEKEVQRLHGRQPSAVKGWQTLLRGLRSHSLGCQTRRSEWRQKDDQRERINKLHTHEEYMLWRKLQVEVSCFVTTPYSSLNGVAQDVEVWRHRQLQKLRKVKAASMDPFEEGGLKT